MKATFKQLVASMLMAWWWQGDLRAGRVLSPRAARVLLPGAQAVVNEVFMVGKQGSMM
jgi:hypothetical protein